MQLSARWITVTAPASMKSAAALGLSRLRLSILGRYGTRSTILRSRSSTDIKLAGHSTLNQFDVPGSLTIMYLKELMIIWGDV
jgi:hypothetical protein